jgi:hypothetical protein
VRFETV